MKSLPNVLRVVVLAPPPGFEPRLEAKGGPQRGERDGSGNVTFETPYVCKEEAEGPALRRDKAGRFSVHVGWHANGRRVGRLDVPLSGVNVVWDCEVTVAGTGEDGKPAMGTASKIEWRNVEDHLSCSMDAFADIGSRPDPEGVTEGSAGSKTPGTAPPEPRPRRGRRSPGRCPGEKPL